MDNDYPGTRLSDGGIGGFLGRSGFKKTSKSGADENGATFQRLFESEYEYGGKSSTLKEDAFAKISALTSCINLIRNKGHLHANLEPLSLDKHFGVTPKMSDYKISQEVIKMPAKVLDKLKNRPYIKTLGRVATVGDVLDKLWEAYCSSVGYEFSQVEDVEEKEWLYKAVEEGRYFLPLNQAQKRYNYQLLMRSTKMEEFLHRSYPGQKWFSLEGTESAILVVDRLIRAATKEGVEQIVMGMAHRGRLNFLANILDKPFEAIMYEFTEKNPKRITDLEHSGWMVDVKYHLGATRARDIDHDGQPDISIQMVPNPSHLELVNPVVLGMTRYYQDERKSKGKKRKGAMALLVHGDAAFAAQGVVSESLNLSQLLGYKTEGSVHLILNNQIGFTTAPEDAYIGRYPSDLARGFNMPVIHVNADDIEACLATANLALDYRQKFGKDILIDLIGYRRFGHNENDDPSVTQPMMYQKIKEHPTALEQFTKQLVGDGVLEEGDAKEDSQEFMDSLFELKSSIAEKVATDFDATKVDLAVVRKKLLSLSEAKDSAALDEQKLGLLNEKLHKFPADFNPHQIALRVVNKRKAQYSQKGGIDWGHGELLAYASLLDNGYNIRLTGQDVERGTFGHRHAVLSDASNGRRWMPLSKIGNAKMHVYNSPLCELGALGFEYGYSVGSNNSLVLWEAQFGDFVNGAQSLIDEMIASGRAKWNQSSSVVLLLPHGFEGQGPNHSSAHLERFLALSARDNMRVISPTTAAQLFCALRSCVFLNKLSKTPMVVITGKSLLRHPMAGSSITDLTSGLFKPIIRSDINEPSASNTKKVVFCTGKVYYDLMSDEEMKERKDIRVVRVEELYPFPTELVEKELKGLPNLGSVVWLQEEPKNRGPWVFVSRHIIPLIKAHHKNLDLEYVGRPATSSPAEGAGWLHKLEQKELIQKALSI